MNGIAIVGTGFIFPGAENDSQFWKMVRDGEDHTQEVPPGRWTLPPASANGGSEPQKDRVRAVRGAFVDLPSIDLRSGALSPDLLKALDPSVQLAVHAGLSACRESRDRLDPDRTQIILGQLLLPTESTSAMAEAIIGDTLEESVLGKENLEDRRPRGVPTCHSLDRHDASLPAAALRAALGLRSGAWTLDAACASALYAVARACEDLLAFRCDQALAGGVSRPDALFTQMGFSQLRALSPEGRCRPLDSRGQGLVVGEGAGILRLQRLEDALQAGEKIHGVIRGWGLSNDRSGGLLAPSGEGQVRAMHQAYDKAGWSPNEVDYIECHATGTPVGDATELKSLQNLWDGHEWQSGQCALGSIKSSIGHTLTAAGSAGLIKVILSMQNGEIPPLPDQRDTPGEFPIENSPFRIPGSAEPWLQQNGRPRRSAVSAFGFGGINAHLLVEEYQPKNPEIRIEQKPRSPLDKPAIAVIGFGLSAGPLQGRESSRPVLLNLDQKEESQGDYPGHFGVPDSHWFGEEGIDLPNGLAFGKMQGSPVEFRIPPTEMKDLLPQQLALLQVTREAIEHSGLEDIGEATSVLVGLGLDPRSSLFHLRWMLPEKGRAWLKDLGIEARQEDVERWIETLQDESSLPLDANRVMGALGSIAASRLARDLGAGGPSHTVSNDDLGGFRALEQAINQLQEGTCDTAVVAAADLGLDIISRVCDARDGLKVRSDAAAALILQRVDDARDNQRKIHGIIEGTGCAAADSLSAGSRTLPAERATQLAMWKNSRPDIVLSTSGHPVNLSMATLIPGTRVVSLPDSLENCGCATPLISVIQGLHMFDSAVLPSNSAERPPIPWLNALTGKASVRVDFRGRLGDHGSLLMKMEETTAEAKDAPLAEVQISANGQLPFGFILSESTTPLHALEGVDQWLSSIDLSALSAGEITRRWMQDHPPQYRSPQALGILFHDRDSLRQALESARKTPVEMQRDLRGENWEIIRSHPTALGFTGETGFVYPGSGSLYPGAGRELFTRFSGALTSTRSDGGMLHRMLSDPSFWSPATPLPQDVRKEILAQVALGGFGTDLLRGFGIEAAIACGHSLGQTAMLFAQGVWKHRQEMQNQLEKGDLFNTWLGGEFRAARKIWHGGEGPDEPWAAVVVDRPRNVVEATLGKQSLKVFLLLTNAPDEVVLGGDPSDLQQLIQDTGWSAVPLSGVTSVHCPLVNEVRDQYRSLHEWPVSSPDHLAKLLCTATGKPLEISSSAIADSILKQALNGFDFPHLIESMWQEGTRIFIEPGPGASCSRLIRKILGSQNYRTLPLFWRGESEELSLIRLLLTCAVERKPVDFSAMLENPSLREPSGPLVEISDGRGPRHIPALPPSMKRRLPLQDSLSIYPVSEVADLPETDSKTSSKRDFVEGNASKEATTPMAPSTQNPISSGNDPSRDIGSPTGAPGDDRRKRLQSRLQKAMGRRQNATVVVDPSPEVESVSAQPVPPPLTEATPVPVSETKTLGDPSSSTVKPVLFDRSQCLEFARGKVAPVLGPVHGEADQFPTRVRLPDEPLMLVDRILSLNGEALSLGSGHIVTEHDVLEDGWYLDSGRIPTSIAVESGQADLFLSGYLGADLHTRGLSVYRLLDAQVTFYSDLPKAGKTILYDIHIDEFFQQDRTLLFRFRFDATVDGEPFLTMRDGCAGFFSPEELASGRGIVQSPHRPRPQPKAPMNWKPPAPNNVSTLDSARLELLRQGNLTASLGPAFERCQLSRPWTLPGGKMTLIDQISELEPSGGDYKLGMVKGELTIHPDDWFLTCHFTDDNVMPGTLMYESCIHTLRVLLMSWGWVGEADEISAMPVPEVAGRLRCRGQVTAETRNVSYEVHVHEIGFRPEPYVIASALMLADGRPIVEMEGLSLRLAGLDETCIRDLWSQESPVKQKENTPVIALDSPGGGGDLPPVASDKPTFYSHEQILSFATGLPSVAFGDRYQVFDGDRFIARLPGPPYCFLDRIVDVKGTPWVVEAGAECTAEYWVPSDAWYFAAGGSGEMPFAVLLEIALQPCGWLAGYVGSALTEDVPLHFRNLGGQATLLRPITPETGLLTTRVKMTAADHGAGMWIQHFDLEVDDSQGPLYRGKTYFGFFPSEALAAQVGLPGAAPRNVPPREALKGKFYSLEQRSPGPSEEFRMLDEVELYVPDGGTAGLGFIRGAIDVNPDAWFFKAHFMGDPVWPGSLGLESMLQLLQEVARDRWGQHGEYVHRSIVCGMEHRWTYRGQVIPDRKRVTVEAQINEIDDERGFLRADGMLVVDGLPIYSMEDFTLERRRES